MEAPKIFTAMYNRGLPSIVCQSIWLSSVVKSVCAKPVQRKKTYIFWRVGENSGAILRRLFTKVHCRFETT